MVKVFFFKTVTFQIIFTHSKGEMYELEYYLGLRDFTCNLLIHQYCRGHGFESCSSLNHFKLVISCLTARVISISFFFLTITV